MDSCSVCKKSKDDAEFIGKNGKKCRICIRCRERSNIYKLKYKCPHGKDKWKCKDCGGRSVCQHGRQGHECRDCGTGFCEHNRVKRSCRDCKGSSRCKHNILKQVCHECNGISICNHGKQKRRCRQCLGILASMRIMLETSRASDIKKDLFNADEFIDMSTLQKLFDDNPNLLCPYCQEEMNMEELNLKLVTIERIDNSIGHTKSNCILACFGCNSKRIGQRK